MTYLLWTHRVIANIQIVTAATLTQPLTGNSKTATAMIRTGIPQT
jgi:phosphatidylethanolamine-binding protein (PEBP) family uncharacterized protein